MRWTAGGEEDTTGYNNNQQILRHHTPCVSYEDDRPPLCKSSLSVESDSKEGSYRRMLLALPPRVEAFGPSPARSTPEPDSLPPPIPLLDRSPVDRRLDRSESLLPVLGVHKSISRCLCPCVESYVRRRPVCFEGDRHGGGVGDRRSTLASGPEALALVPLVSGVDPTGPKAPT